MTLIQRIIITIGLSAILGCEERPRESEVVKEAEGDRPSSNTPLTIENIETMPKGFDVVHSPRDVGAIETGNPESPYRWEHEEAVTPLVDNLTIQEFGYIVVVNGERRLISFAWDRKPYDRSDFAIFFGCEERPLKKGKRYIRTDWTENESLEKSEMTSYFVGEDEAGKLYSGYSKVTKLPELKATGEQGVRGHTATPPRVGD